MLLAKKITGSVSERTLKLALLGAARLNILSIAVLFFCAGCGSGGGNSAGSGSPEADRIAAEQKLNRMLEAKRKQNAETAEQERIAQEKAAQAAAEAAKPRYDPSRLAIAVKWRQWADITIPDLNIKCWLKTNWNNGKMHLRLALLGDKTALRLFTGNWPYLRLVFSDQGGNNLHQCILATNELHWDESGLRNSGVPTMDYEADDECPLEVYESIVQWHVKWENQI